MKTTGTALVLGILSFALFLWRIQNPPNYSFDELQYINSARALLAHLPNPNPEAPPLGKLLIAAGIKSLGDNALGWRAPSALCGALTLAGVFLWVEILTADYGIALAAALLTLLNNFLYVFSRTAMMDISLVCFMIWGLVAFTAAIKIDSWSAASRRILLTLSGIAFGLSCAAKWNGLDTVAAVFVLSVAAWALGPRTENAEFASLARRMRQIGLTWVVVSFVLVPILAYAATFLPVMRSVQRPIRIGEFLSMNFYIWKFHLAVPGNPLLVSSWYTWPFRTGPLRDLSYLVGNWYVMWAGLPALVWCARRFGRSLAETLVVSLYLVHLLQWAATPQSCLYYYYYFPAAIFLGIAIPLALRQLPERVWGVRWKVAAVVPAVVVFLFCFQRMAHLTPPFDCALGCWP